MESCNYCEEQTYSVCLNCGIFICDSCRINLFCNKCTSLESHKHSKKMCYKRAEKGVNFLCLKLRPVESAILKNTIKYYEQNEIIKYNDGIEQLTRVLTPQALDFIDKIKDVCDGESPVIDIEALPSIFIVYKPVRKGFRIS